MNTMKSLLTSFETMTPSHHVLNDRIFENQNNRKKQNHFRRNAINKNERNPEETFTITISPRQLNNGSIDNFDPTKIARRIDIKTH